jgi:hypothetical protein
MATITPDTVQTLKNSRPVAPETRNLYRHRGSLVELLNYLEKEHAAYAATAKAYWESQGRAEHGAVAKAAHEVAKALSPAIAVMKEAQVRTNERDWSAT